MKEFKKQLEAPEMKKPKVKALCTEAMIYASSGTAKSDLVTLLCNSFAQLKGLRPADPPAANPPVADPQAADPEPGDEEGPWPMELRND